MATHIALDDRIIPLVVILVAVDVAANHATVIGVLLHVVLNVVFIIRGGSVDERWDLVPVELLVVCFFAVVIVLCGSQ